jgi:hypothetical protein
MGHPPSQGVQAMDIEKAKLPKGMSYPLRSSYLSEALRAAGITLAAHLIHQPASILFEAHFWPPNPRIRHERLYIIVAAVPALQRRFAREYLEGTAVREFVAWVQDIVSLAPNSPVRREQQYFRRDLP